MKAYDHYKTSGVDWIGEIPEHWQVKKLKYSTACNRLTLSEKTDDDFELEYIDISSVDSGGKLLGVEKYSFMDAPSRARRVVASGDTIISTVRTYLKAIAYVDTQKPNLICSTGFAVITPDRNLFHPKFLYFLCRSELFVEEICAVSKGVSYPAIDSGDIRSFYLWIPPLAEQAAIADYLDRETAEIDELVERKKRLIELLKEERLAIINQAVTRGLDSNVKLKPSGIEWLGDIPAHWEIMPIKYIVSTKVTDGPHETPFLYPDGVPFASAEAVKNGKINLDSVRGFISKEQDEAFSRKVKPRRNDIFIVKSGATTGRVAIVDFDDDFNIWSPLALVRTNEEIAHSWFVYYALQAVYFQDQIKFSWSYGTQQNIGMGVIENLRVMFPQSLSMQRAIVRHIESKTRQVDMTMLKIETEIGLLCEYRTALISEVVTGKRRISEN